MSSISGAGSGGGGGGVGNVKFLKGNDSISVGPDVSGTINTLGTHGINTTGNAGTNTETWALNNAITLGDLSSIIGSPAITLTTGDITLSAGNVNLPATNSAGTEGIITNATRPIIAFPGAFDSNILMGVGAGNLSLTNSTRTIAIGTNAGHGITSGNQTTIVGYQAASNLSSGSNSTIVGYNAGSNITTGSNNTLYGSNAGVSLSSSAANNILIGNAAGALLVSTNSGNIYLGYGSTTAGNATNTISIGFTNSGASTQTACYIDGIAGVSVTGSPVVIDANGQLGVGSGSGVTTINGDSGSATGSTITFNAAGSTLMGTTFAFNASGSTVELVAQDANNNLALAGGNSTYIAQGVTQNTLLGFDTGLNLTSGATANVFAGYNAGSSATASFYNTAVGWNALEAFTSSGTGADQNVAIGQSALFQLTTGITNVAIGAGVGTLYTGSESKNIIIGGAYGVATENNKIRIGYYGNVPSQTGCFIDGISGQTGSVGTQMCTVDSTGQLCSAPLPTAPSASVAFYAVKTTNQTITANTTSAITFGTEIYDLGNNFASNAFTAPTSGKLYQFNVTINATSASVTDLIQLRVNSTAVNIFEPGVVSTSSYTITATLMLSSGDVVDVAYDNNAVATGATITGQASPYATYFSGYQLN